MLWLCFKDADQPQAIYGNIMETLIEDGTFNLCIRSNQKMFTVIVSGRDDVMF